MSIPSVIVLVPIMRLIKCCFCVKRTQRGGFKWFCPAFCIKKVCGCLDDEKSNEDTATIDVGTGVLLVSGLNEEKNIK